MSRKGENPKYCSDCRKKFDNENCDLPCFECERKSPDLMVVNEICVEAHELCFDARDGMSGALDFGFLGKCMDLMRLDNEEQLNIIHKIRRVESFLRESNKKSGK